MPSKKRNVSLHILYHIHQRPPPPLNFNGRDTVFMQLQSCESCSVNHGVHAMKPHHNALAPKHFRVHVTKLIWLTLWSRARRLAMTQPTKSDMSELVVAFQLSRTRSLVIFSGRYCSHITTRKESNTATIDQVCDEGPTVALLVHREIRRHALVAFELRLSWFTRVENAPCVRAPTVGLQ